MSRIYTDPAALAGWLKDNHVSRLLVISDPVVRQLPLYDRLRPLAAVWFDEVRPNPLYEDVCAAVAQFRRQSCDGILAVGGGSAIDTAKCVKLWCRMAPEQGVFLTQPYGDTGVPLAAMPTTAGTGSEATHFAVAYYNGVKQSIAHESLRPDAAFLIPELLFTLPLYQKKATLLDALCQAVESIWAVRATPESTAHAAAAITRIRAHMDAYLAGDRTVCGEIQRAAYEAGCAINITTTTAAHAMSYKLTSLYGIAHGHAVGLCMRALWPFMVTHPERTVLPGGKAAQQAVFDRLAALFEAADAADAAQKYAALYDKLALPTPSVTAEEREQLVSAVNPQRLQNNPIPLSAADIRGLLTF
ncbi:MAG: phosphonoacetaldehyde reductase [Clostridia bacterium]|nr:phosphonoacetaldehyde reductase [Clostridia bacterium]